jgi:hypothetical protein
LDSKSDETIAHVGRWTTDEDSTLKEAVGKHNGEDWAAISALVPGRTRAQCLNRWHDNLRSKIDEATARVAKKWTKEEDSTLKDAVEKHNGKNWTAISALVLGRTRTQCTSRWYNTFRSKGDETTARVGKWTKEEGKLKDAVKKHNGKNWEEISALVPGRTKEQCMSRWHGGLAFMRDETTAHVGKWTKEEDNTLNDAVKKHNGEDWAAISALVPGRTKTQCRGRWHDVLVSKRKGGWTTGEDSTLKAQW